MISKLMYIVMLMPLARVAAASSTIGDVANNITMQAPPWELMITGAAYSIGLAFIISGTIKFKNHRDAPQQVPLTAPIVLVSIGGLIFYFPSTIDMLASTFFGSGSLTTGAYLFKGIGTLIDGSTLTTVTNLSK